MITIPLEVLWSAMQAAKILLGLLVHCLPAGTPLVIGVDETSERWYKLKLPESFRIKREKNLLLSSIAKNFIYDR